MRKYLLLTTLLLTAIVTFGQSSDWGSWTPVSCYTRLSTSVLGNGYVPTIKEYSWQVRIKSSYSKRVTFNMTWIVGGERLSIGQVTLNPGESYGHTSRYFKSSSNNIVVEVSEVCFEGQDCYKYGYADCNGNQAKISDNSTSTNSSTQTNNSTQQNDLTEYNRSKADLERQMQQQNQEIANRNAETQRQQQLLKQQQEQQRQQQLQQGINQLTTATADLVTLLASRKRASKSSLSNEDVQVLLGIVNSETPLNYAQNVIDIFSDLGYTFKSSEMMSYGGLYISMYDNSTIQWPLTITIDPASKYDPYNKINFDYQRKNKLLNQLSALGNNLIGFTIKGISTSRQQEIEEKQIEDNRKKEEEEQRKTVTKEKIAEIIPVKSSKVIDENITIQSIIDRCIIAMGGIDKLKLVDNITEYCENESSNFKTITTYGKFAFFGNFGEKSSKKVFDGSNGYFEYDGRKNALNERDILFLKKTQPFYILELKSRQDLTLGAFETIGNKDYVTIIKPSEMINGTTYTTKLYFEMDSGLYFGSATSSSYNSDISYSFLYDYREIKGIKFPFTKINAYGNNSFSKTTTTEIKLNEPLSDNDFK